jgi:hypothetical protein
MLLDERVRRTMVLCIFDEEDEGRDDEDEEEDDENNDDEVLGIALSRDSLRRS